MVIDEKTKDVKLENLTHLVEDVHKVITQTLNLPCHSIYRPSCLMLQSRSVNIFPLWLNRLTATVGEYEQQHGKSLEPNITFYFCTSKFVSISLLLSNTKL